jgi:hypothetical protein
MAIHYIIHVSDDHRLDVHADKINLGIRKLWFYDSDDNLQAVFRWDSILGFSVEGPASGQVVIEELAHERKMEGKKAESFEQQPHGRLLATLENADQALEGVKSN